MSKDDKASSKNPIPWKELLAFVGAVLVASLGYLGIRLQIERPIQATQTAEARLLTFTKIPTQTQVPTATQMIIPTETMTSTETLTYTPTPIFVVDTSNRVGWVPNFVNSNGDNTINEVSSDENAIKLTYDIGNSGYVSITKKISTGLLEDTKGISFFYKGRGAPNSIEFKLMLRFPGDSDDTTYGILIPSATDTENRWVTVNIRYNEMECWWPEEYCEKHGDLIDTKMVDRLDFVVSNKEGDNKGSGWVIFKDVVGIRP